MQETIIKGKKIRTNNNDIDAIMELWQTIFPLQLKGDMYAVYYNYASNHLGDYDLLIGTTTANLKESIQLKETKYIVVPVENNDIQNINKAWQAIWNDSQLEAKRTYQTDYEKYSEDGSITIHISVQ
ncbi:MULTISPECIES: effector binding domain-containing protein [unclassified Breznakia]|uniref:GyrI-like domain-containing protein n=1 Tax=unclassified Breznakia TaxID=2623764 RepID=UPI002406F4D6|nr:MULTISPECIES: effector binding domain-containing protein [unclassified Breznakia]MDF9837357.1 putative transcriptional regulator YdeE [Breznakia sp. PFB2-8]MDF9859292.1 putative transcriptional regulator YdeE [Breznakia sp. PH5-24]